MAYQKFFTLSFDDGLEQDKKIIRILKEYGITGCTFNLNSGLMGQKKVMGRLGEYGFMESDDLTLAGKKKGLFHYVEDFRIPEDEIAQVYEGFEVASHGYLHENLKKLHGEELEASIQKDLANLRRITGQEIHGFAYPFGAVSDEAAAVLKKNGIRYARTTRPGDGFRLPKDPLRLGPTHYLPQKDTLQVVEQFIHSEPTEEDQMLYLWGHGYEFDFGTPRNNWDNLKKICSRIAGAEGIRCCTNYELFDGSGEAALYSPGV